MLTQEEYESPCNVSAFLHRVEDQIEAVASSEHGTSKIRFRRGIAKELVEEALPAAVFLDRFFAKRNDIEIQMVRGNQDHDAVLRYLRGGDEPIRFVEVTQAHEGVDSYYRMRALEQHRHVSLYGKVETKRVKGQGLSVDVEGMAHSHTAIQRRELELVSAAIDRKANIVYPERTALVVVFQDAIAARETDDCSPFVELINEKAGQLVSCSHLALVGWGKRFFYVVEKPNRAT